MAFVFLAGRNLLRRCSAYRSHRLAINEPQTSIAALCTLGGISVVGTRIDLSRGVKFVRVAIVALFFIAPPVLGMEFYWGSVPTVLAQDNGRNNTLYMRGDIQAGDYAKFKAFVSRDLTKYIQSPKIIVLASNGGDLLEALRIAELLKEMLGDVHVLDAKCASSCLFLFLSGKFRYAGPGLVGVHRAYFEPRYFAGLSASEAQKRQAELTRAIKNILGESGVPQYLVEKMNQMSSAEVYWLNEEDLEKVGLRPAWYEELLIAKCGFDKRLEETFRSTPAYATQYDSIKAAYSANVKRVSNCEWDVVEPELEKLQVRLRSDRVQPKSK